MSKSLTDLLFSPTEVLNGYGREANKFASAYHLDENTVHNGEWDAFRHCYGSGVMAIEYGTTIAHIAGTAKEIYQDLFDKNHSEGEGTMDRASNAVGLSVAERAANQTGDREQSDVSHEKIAELCIEALRQGELARGIEEAKQREYGNPKTEDHPRIEKPGAPQTDAPPICEESRVGKGVTDSTQRDTQERALRERDATPISENQRVP